MPALRIGIAAMRRGGRYGNIDESAKSKTVVTADSSMVGTIVNADNSTANVEPNPGLMDEVAAKLGRGDGDEEIYELNNDAIETVTDDEIRPKEYN